MAKLYFRYGTVGSAKTLNLLAVAHNYEQQEKRILLLKPEIDTRYGKGVIKSRAGLQKEADLLLGENTTLEPEYLTGVSCVLVDEAQFLSSFVVDQLADIAHEMKIPVICYGLRTDFRRNLFPGARRLMEIADAIEEVKTTCAYCNRKAIFNLKHVDGTPTFDGPIIELGTEETYLPACSHCYRDKLAATRKRRENLTGGTSKLLDH